MLKKRRKRTRRACRDPKTIVLGATDRRYFDHVSQKFRITRHRFPERQLDMEHLNMRTVDYHKINPLNDKLDVIVADVPHATGTEKEGDVVADIPVTESQSLAISLIV